MMSDSMPPASSRSQRQQDAQLAAAEQEFPGWDIFEVFGGWQAVPAGTPVVQALDLDGIVSKLRGLRA